MATFPFHYYPLLISNASHLAHYGWKLCGSGNKSRRDPFPSHQPASSPLATFSHKELLRVKSSHKLSSCRSVTITLARLNAYLMHLTFSRPSLPHIRESLSLAITICAVQYINVLCYAALQKRSACWVP